MILEAMKRIRALERRVAELEAQLAEQQAQEQRGKRKRRSSNGRAKQIHSEAGES